jgi:hypothetical protein
MLANFTQVTASDFGIGNVRWTQLLTDWERARALSLCEEGQIVPLVQHLALTEFHMRNGAQRRNLLQSGNRQGVGAEALHSERLGLAKNSNVTVPSVAEESVVALFLDRLLSWPRVTALLKNGGKPGTVKPSDDKDEPE